MQGRDYEFDADIGKVCERLKKKEEDKDKEEELATELVWS